MCCLQHRIRWIDFSDHRRNTFAQNAGFFTADTVAVVPQVLLVVQPYRGDYRAVRIDDVYGIQPTAQPYFKNRVVDLCMGQALDGSQRSKLEIAQWGVAPGLFDHLE